MTKILNFNVKNYISAYFDNMLIDNRNKGKLLAGEIYTINSSNDNINNNVYKIIKVIHKINDVELNSCVAKRINENENECIFSLTKGDCELIGVDFQEKLELLPLNLDWKIIDKNDSDSFFEENDLSTYPLDYNTKTIKNIVAKINMKSLLDNETEFFNLYKKSNSALRFRLNDDTLYNGEPLSYYFNMDYKLITNKISLNKNPYDNLIDLDGNIFIEIDFYSKKNNTIGIVPQLVKNKSINDIIVSEIILYSKYNKEEEENRLRRDLSYRLKERYAQTTLSNIYESQINFFKTRYYLYNEI